MATLPSPHPNAGCHLVAMPALCWGQPPGVSRGRGTSAVGHGEGGWRGSPVFRTVLLAPCSQAESPAMIPAPYPGGLPSRWNMLEVVVMRLTAHCPALSAAASRHGWSPILALRGRVAWTVHPCRPGGSRAPSPTAGHSLAPCPSSATLSAAPRADSTQSCLYLFKSRLASIRLKNPTTTLLYNFA